MTEPDNSVTNRALEEWQTKADRARLSEDFSRAVDFALPLTQEAKEGSCTPSLSVDSLHFGASGGSGSVTVQAPTGCAWRLSGEIGWLNINDNMKEGSGPASVAFSVAPNQGSTSRTAAVTLAGHILSVTQEGAQLTVRR